MNKDMYPVGTRLIAQTGKKKKSAIVEILISEWSPSGDYFKAAIRDTTKTKYGWVSASKYNVVEVFSNPLDGIKTKFELAYKASYEKQLEGSINDVTLTTIAVNAINSIVNRFPVAKQDSIRETIFKLRTIEDINRLCELNPALLATDLQEDMLVEFSSKWKDILPKQSWRGMGVAVGTLTGVTSSLAPREGFLDKATKPLDKKAPCPTEPDSNPNERLTDSKLGFDVGHDVEYTKPTEQLVELGDAHDVIAVHKNLDDFKEGKAFKNLDDLIKQGRVYKPNLDDLIKQGKVKQVPIQTHTTEDIGNEAPSTPIIGTLSGDSVSILPYDIVDADGAENSSGSSSGEIDRE